MPSVDVKRCARRSWRRSSSRCQNEESIRVWVPGCATGEEVYTLAILFREEIARRDFACDLVIFGSDVDQSALATAREGSYSLAVAADVSEARLARYFRAEGDHYRVTNEVRDCVVFAVHSVLRDPPFSKLHLISCPQAGLGIGLALAKSLVEMHGGAIGVASNGLDGGSEFTVRLPARPATTAALVAEPAALNGDWGGHCVLVVDDNVDAANTLALLIRTLGQNDVHVAFSGAEALPLAARLRPDTVFLDLKMPEMDGFEVARRLRDEPWGSAATLVALTGWGLEYHKRRTHEAGFDQHLTKPANIAALQSILGRHGGARVN